MVHGIEFDWIEAAHADNLSYEEFREKPIEYQEKLIAYYHTSKQIQAVMAWANRPRKHPKPGPGLRRRRR